MPDVFISYNRQDRDVAQRVAASLGEEGFDVWWDGVLRSGETYDEVTERNLRDAGAVVVLWSKRSANSKWVRAEATVGERSSTLVPALIEDCDRPVRFELVQTADLRHWRGDRNDPAWRLFVLDIREAVANRKAAPPASQRAAPAPDATVETAFWTSIKDSQDAAEYDAYLSRYPEGHFADLAKARLRQLKQAAAKPAPARQEEAPARPRPAPPPPAPEKSRAGVNPLAIVAAAVATVAVIGGGAFFLLRPGTKAVQTAAAPVPEVDKPALQSPPIGPAPAVAKEPSPAPTTPSDPTPDPPPAETVAPPQPPSPPVEKSYTPCPDCPTMVRLPGGAFKMGSPDQERGRNPWESPQHPVTIAPFAIAATETTEAQWAACVADGQCRAKRSLGGATAPVLGVTWREATGYAAWLSRKTGKAFRLPSEAEWEYAARGGTASAYWWGETFEAGKVARGAPKASGSFAPNGFGLFDISGNAREWVEDCYVNNFTATPTDGSPNRIGDCRLRTIRDGYWSSSPSDLRVANRGRLAADASAEYLGFRVAGPAQ